MSMPPPSTPFAAPRPASKSKKRVHDPAADSPLPPGTDERRKRSRVQFNLASNTELEDDDHARQAPDTFMDIDDDDEEDEEVDEDALDLERGRGKRRMKLRQGGSDSEDSDDGEGPCSSRARSNDVDDDDDDDMFTDEKRKNKKPSGSKSYKGLSHDDMRSFEAMDAAVQQEEDEDDPEAIKIVPFNMRDELEEGSFDEAGTYIKKRDENERYDAWLSGLNKTDIEKAALAARAREQERQAHEHAVASRTRIPNREPDLLKGALGLLRPRETVARALARLNKQIERPSKRSTSSKKAAKPAAPESEVSRHAREDVDLLTEIAGQLVELGKADVYEASYEDMMADLRDEGLVDRAWTPEHPTRRKEEVAFTYAWSGGDGAEHGPFAAEEMAAWAAQGFFANGIVVQKLVNGAPSGDKVTTTGDMFASVEPASV
ncbi:hypothetical protein AMAG_16498 [Allomyces macrogynus ATCC 38327]|uniref:GYF domain-containing protein n=1 Tax=Allomyces macrogynus (strain ATCC 38327) TaxID=578462 RepID=A0A0L0TD66_ALLM3|nr:hypothetical protein AMAG_16498 [Allomyces macrogynus ATCC 38327]|eukprot:KNE72454.1 hypothetical protein AMAG_16498 [Allomyces macrogynus ATCC 38327]